VLRRFKESWGNAQLTAAQTQVVTLCVEPLCHSAGPVYEHLACLQFDFALAKASENVLHSAKKQNLTHR
jgi:hypothetical protein